MRQAAWLTAICVLSPIYSRGQIWLERPAQRVTLVEGGGYFPVTIRLKTGEILSILRGGAPHIGARAGSIRSHCAPG